MLDSVRTVVYGEIGVNPAGRDGVNPDFARKTDRKRVGQRGDTALGRGVALGLGLTHAVARGRNVDDRCTGREIGRKALGQIERCGDTDAQRVVKLFVGAFVNAFHERQRVVDKHIHPSIVCNDLVCKGIEHGLIGQIADKIVVFQQVNHAYVRTGLAEFIRDGLADALGTAGHDDDTVLEHGQASF